MRIAVAGLWHLGTVTAACLAANGHEVTGYDPNPEVIDGLAHNRLPVAEPGLLDLLESAVSAGALRFSADPGDIASSEILWICFDTPVDENDVADVGYVQGEVLRLLPFLESGSLVLISSQLPAGSTALLEAACAPGRFAFAYSPENLRLGNAIEAFTKADRVVVGIRWESDRVRLDSLFRPFAKEICWMSVESAEMTKHALNAFLATSVAFINEIAVLCEKTGADAQEVERGLKTDPRIGKRAYLHAGGAFAGGTLARDIAFLLQIGGQHGLPAYMLTGVRRSNEIHKSWARRRLIELISDLHHCTVAVLGLTYKPGTNTLRRSSAVEFCWWVSEQGATVTAFDPSLAGLPPELAFIQRKDSAEEALSGADAALVATEWPEFRELEPDAFARDMRRPLVLDPARFLEHKLASDKRIQYIAIGRRHEVS